MPTHYEVLGVAPDASAARVRAAYLAKARVLHPDRQVGRGRAEVAAAQRSMQDVNAAWTVLSDPRARREYDATLRPRAASPHASAARPMPPRATRPVVVLDEDDDAGPPLPFLVRVGPIVVLLGVLVAIVVVTAFAAGGRLVDPDTYGTVDPGTPEVGTCIDVNRIEVVPIGCESAVAMRVEAVVAPGDSCDGGTVPVWWEEDEVLCVRPKS